MEREKKNEKKKRGGIEQCSRHPKRGNNWTKERLNTLAST
jgi:hypothetical protein